MSGLIAEVTTTISRLEERLRGIRFDEEDYTKIMGKLDGLKDQLCAAKTPTFVREERYIIFKKTDVMYALNSKEQRELRQLHSFVNNNRCNKGKPPLKCVVVESDWPEYEPTWDAIEERMTGEPKRFSGLDTNNFHRQKTHLDNLNTFLAEKGSSLRSWEKELYSKERKLKEKEEKLNSLEDDLESIRENILSRFKRIIRVE